MPRDSMAVAPQPAPVASTTAPSAHDLVIADLQDRKAMGLKKYNTILQPHNGRDSLVDAYQEVLDLAAYLRNEIEKRNDLQHQIIGCNARIHDLEKENARLIDRLRDSGLRLR